MKEGELRDLLEQSGLDPAFSKTPVSVLVSLLVPEPSPSLLADLERIGLVVDRVIGSTILGSIEPNNMPELLRNEDVREVEPSQPLRINDRG